MGVLKLVVALQCVLSNSRRSWFGYGMNLAVGFYITLPKHGYQVVNEADELSAINTDTLMKAFLQDGLVKEWQLQAGASQFEETPWAK